MKKKTTRQLAYIDKFLGKYAQIQAWTFIILMVLVAIIYMQDPSAHNYEIVSKDKDSLQVWAENINISIGEEHNSNPEFTLNETTETITYQKISSKKAEEMQKRYNKLATIALICILGMLFSQKEKRERLKEIYKQIKRKIQ